MGLGASIIHVCNAKSGDEREDKRTYPGQNKETNPDSEAHKCGVIRNTSCRSNHIPLNVVQQRFESSSTSGKTSREGKNTTTRDDIECLSFSDQELDNIEEAMRHRHTGSRHSHTKTGGEMDHIQTVVNENNNLLEPTNKQPPCKEAWSKTDYTDKHTIKSPRKILESIQKVASPKLQKQKQSEFIDNTDSKYPGDRNVLLTEFCSTSDDLSGNIGNLTPVNLTQGHSWYSAYAREQANTSKSNLCDVDIPNAIPMEENITPNVTSSPVVNRQEYFWEGGARPKGGKDKSLKPIALDTKKRNDQAHILNQLRQEGVVQTPLHQERQAKEKLKLQELKDIGIIPDLKLNNYAHAESPSLSPDDDGDENNNNDDGILFKTKVKSHSVRLASVLDGGFQPATDQQLEDEYEVDALLRSLDREIAKSDAELLVSKKSKSSITSRDRGMKTRSNISQDNIRRVAVVTPNQRPRAQTEHNDGCPDEAPTTGNAPQDKLVDGTRMAEIEQLIVDLDIAV